MLEAAIGGLAWFNRLIERAGVFFACALIAMMTASVLLQVISREMRSPVGWTEEVALAAMVWVTFLVAPYGYRRHLFTRVDVFVDKLDIRLRARLFLGLHLIELVLLIGAVTLAWAFYLRGNAVMPQMSRLLKDAAAPFVEPDVVMGLAVRNRAVYAALPLGLAAMILVSVEHILRGIATVATGRDHAVRPEDQHENIPVSIAGGDAHLTDDEEIRR